MAADFLAGGSLRPPEASQWLLFLLTGQMIFSFFPTFSNVASA
jgi:hypothetical protein